MGYVDYWGGVRMRVGRQVLGESVGVGERVGRECTLYFCVGRMDC